MQRAALVSAAAHAVVLLSFAIWFAAPSPLPEAPDQGIKVELVLLETRGAGKPAQQAPPQQPARAPGPPTERKPPSAIPPPPPVAAVTLPLPPPPPSTPSRQRPPDQSASAARLSVPKPPAPHDSSGGTDSISNTIATGDSVVPARPDASYHNREPIYPPDAASRGERGVVTLLIHVSPAGLATGVEVTKSSGFMLLDRAAQDAI
ncbi:MAG: energy transducer TonB [Acetobacteraceae bacterium]